MDSKTIKKLITAKNTSKLTEVLYEVLNTIDSDSLSLSFLKADEKTGYYMHGFYMGLSPPILWETIEKHCLNINLKSYEDILKIYNMYKKGYENIVVKIRNMPEFDNIIYFTNDNIDEDEYYENPEEYIKKSSHIINAKE